MGNKTKEEGFTGHIVCWVNEGWAGSGSNAEKGNIRKWGKQIHESRT